MAKATTSKTAPKTKAAPKKASTKAAAAPRSVARKTKAKTTTPKTPAMPAYLAAELGQPLDHRGEPIGAGSAMARTDGDLQDYTLQLWRQMQSGRVVNRYTRAIERAGLTIDDVWTAGIADSRPTSSTPDEMRRYKQKVLFRANLLEAILSETIADLHRLERIEPTPPDDGPKAPAEAG